MNPSRLREAFTARFGRACAALARAPGRVNLIGEHTDYNEGYVLPMALEQSTWVACADRNDGVARVYSVNLEDGQEWTIGAWNGDQSPHWTSYVAGVAELLCQRSPRLEGFDLLIESEVPVGAGLASSAALEVAGALALSAVRGEALGPIELVNLCRQAEHEFAGVPCGIMDQFVSLLARSDNAFLLDCRSRTYEHVPCALPGHVVLVVGSGVRRELAAGEYARRQRECQVAAEHFQRYDPGVRALRDVSVQTVRSHAPRMDPRSAARSLHVTTEIQRTLAAVEALGSGDLIEFGRLMVASHLSLRDNFEVSCPELDQLVDILTGVDGVLGARMTGGGFGGSVVALARETCLARIKNELRARYSTPNGAACRMLASRPGRGAGLHCA